MMHLTFAICFCLCLRYLSMSAGARTVMHHLPVINTYQCAYSNGKAHMMIFQALGFFPKTVCNYTWAFWLHWTGRTPSMLNFLCDCKEDVSLGLEVVSIWFQFESAYWQSDLFKLSTHDIACMRCHSLALSFSHSDTHSSVLLCALSRAKQMYMLETIPLNRDS